MYIKSRRKHALQPTFAVFCGSSEEVVQEHYDCAYGIGEVIGRSGSKLLYGGGGLGCMGALARGALSRGGEVVGIIPEFLDKDWVHQDVICDKVVVDDMEARKRYIFEKSDIIICLPGGVGTLEEACAALTLSQLGQRKFKLLFYNTGGFWNPFFSQVSTMRELKYVHSKHEVAFEVIDHIDTMLNVISKAVDRQRCVAA